MAALPSARRLLALDALERRRAGRAGPLPLAVAAGLLAASALGAIAWRVDVAEAWGWWLVLLVGGSGTLVLRAPWRFFWHPGARLCARLPIPGRTLYELGALRGAREAAALAVAVTLAGVPLLVVGGGAGAGWLAFAWIGPTLGALVAPMAALVAGTMTTSNRAQATLKDAAGGVSGPAVVWLSLVPALAGVAVGGALLLAVSAAGRSLAEGAALAAGALAVGAGVLLGGRRAAAGLPDVTRDVAALDAVILAHVELDGAKGLEAVWGDVATGPGRAIYRKDVALLRRRHPGYYLLTGALILALWGVALFADPPTRGRWIVILALTLCAYLPIVARRLVVPPVEHPRLGRILPLPAHAWTRAKRAYLFWRTIVPLGLGAAPGIWREGGALAVLGPVAAAALVALVIAWWRVRPGDGAVAVGA